MAFIGGFYAGAAAVCVALLIVRYFAYGSSSLKPRRLKLPAATAWQIKRADKARRLRLGVAPQRWIPAPRQTYDEERP